MPRSRPGPAILSPRTSTWPVVGSSNPATMRSRVDFPHPEAPIRQTNCPFSIVRSILESARISSSPTEKLLVTPRIASCGPAGASFMVLRAPAQDPVADHHDDAVGDEAGDPDHDHAGD